MSTPLSFSIAPVNDPVVIDENSPLTFNTDEDVAIEITEAALLNNASDVDGDALSVMNVTVDNASVTTIIDPQTGDRSFLVTPDEDYNGTLDIDFDVTDDNGSMVESGATLSVTATNDAADAVDDTGSATEGAGAVSFDVLANDSHPDGDSFTLTNAEVTEGNGSVSIVNGEVVFNPDVSHNELADGETADVTVSYTIEDADGEESTAELTITVTGTNDAPDVSLTGSSVDENAVGGTIVGDLAAIDPDNGDSHTYAVDDASSPFEVVDGQLVVKDGAELNYEDNSSVDVDVTVTDAEGASTTKTFTVDLNDMSASAPTISVSADGGFSTSLSGSEPMGDWQTDNANGSIENNHADYVYTGFDDGRGTVIELEAGHGDESNLYQDLDIKTGDTVELSFDYSARVNHEGENSQIDVYFEGELIDSISTDQAGWETHTYQLTATEDSPRLEFDAPGSNSVGGVLDEINVEQIHVEDEPVGLNFDISATNLTMRNPSAKY